MFGYQMLRAASVHHDVPRVRPGRQSACLQAVLTWREVALPNDVTQAGFSAIETLYTPDVASLNMDMDPRRLQVLLAVARAGGVLAAAEELRVTPSAVSQQLSKLEREAGRALVERNPQGTALTPAGRVVAQAAEEIERALNVARGRLEEGASEVEGTARVGGLPSFLRTVIVPRLHVWRQRHPRLQVQVVEEDASSLMRLLRRGELDAVVAELDVGDERAELSPGMTELPILDEPWKLIVPAGSLATASGVDLSRLHIPWLGLEPSAVSAAPIDRLRRTVEIQAASVHQYQETLTALALVAAGEGMTVIPALALHGTLQEGVDVLDLPGLGSRRIVLRRFDRRRGANTVVDTVVRLIREAVADLDLDASVFE